MSSPGLIKPGQVSVPAGISFHGLEMPGGAGIVQLRDLLIAAALHALLGRETSTLLPVERLGYLAVAAADAALAARSVGTATPAAPASPVREG